MTSAALQRQPRHPVTCPVWVATLRGDFEESTVQDISLGGLFVRMRAPPAPGSSVRLRLYPPREDVPVSLRGRVVHVIDVAQGLAKARNPGMGVEFDGLTGEYEVRLKKLVDSLLKRARVRAAWKAPARFVDAMHVEVSADRAALRRLWAQGLDAGRLQADGLSRVGGRVSVAIGPLALFAEVMATSAPCQVRLQLVDLTESRRAAIARFLAGTTERIEVPPSQEDRARSLFDVLADARRLFTMLDLAEPFAAVGLTRDATPAQIRSRCTSLAASFRAAWPEAPLPQRAPLERAALVVSELEPRLLARVDRRAGRD